MSINCVMVSGNLGRDAELRDSRAGTPMLTFSMAVNERAKNPQTGEWEDRANWVDCIMFGSRAEKLAPYLAKGSKVAVQGRLRYSSWERDGQRRVKLDVVVNELEFLSRGDSPRQAAPAQAPAAPPLYDSEIPF